MAVDFGLPDIMGVVKRKCRRLAGNAMSINQSIKNGMELAINGLPALVGGVGARARVDVALSVLPLAQFDKPAWIVVLWGLRVLPGLVDVALRAVNHGLLRPRVDGDAGGGARDVDVFALHGVLDALLDAGNDLPGKEANYTNGNEDSDQDDGRL